MQMEQEEYNKYCPHSRSLKVKLMMTSPTIATTRNSGVASSRKMSYTCTLLEI